MYTLNTLVGKDDIWTMAAIIIGWAAISIILEQKYKWASKVTGAVVALVGAMILSNLNIIPIGSAFEDVVWSYVVPLAIPLLLFRANLIKIGKEAGRFLILFLASSLGTVLGAILGIVLVGKLIDQLPAVSAMMTGSYIGGSVNFAAMADSYNAGDSITSAAVVADNLVMVLYIMLLISIPTINFFRRKYSTPLIDELEKNTSSSDNVAQEYWKAKDISLKDIASNIAIGVVLVAISTIISSEIKSFFVGDDVLSVIITNFFGNMYLILTTLSLIIATVFSSYFEKLSGSQEIGTFLIYIFFVVIGIPASIMGIITNAPILLVFALIMVVVNMAVTFIFAKIFNYTLEESILASNANIGGPTTAAALAISKGWSSMIAPVMLVGTLGYVFGNYFGIFIAYLSQFLI